METRLTQVMFSYFTAYNIESSTATY